MTKWSQKFFLAALMALSALLVTSADVHAKSVSEFFLGNPQTPSCYFQTYYLKSENQFLAVMTGTGLADCQSCAMKACESSQGYQECKVPEKKTVVRSGDMYCVIQGQ